MHEVMLHNTKYTLKRKKNDNKKNNREIKKRQNNIKTGGCRSEKGVYIK